MVPVLGHWCAFLQSGKLTFRTREENFALFCELVGHPTPLSFRACTTGPKLTLTTAAAAGPPAAGWRRHLSLELATPRLRFHQEN